MEAASLTPTTVIDRYAVYSEIASGGMATVHLGRLMGAVGFSRAVAIKRLHPHFAKDREFVSMFLDEARLAARIRHPNVVPTLDVVSTPVELFLVMDFVVGESLSGLIRRAHERRMAIPPHIVGGIMSGVLHGLHAAHEARGEDGTALGIVHRDVSPQNILVGADGVSRVLDFGVAKAIGRLQTTREGQLKGKLAYMAPEQLNGEVNRKTDIFAAGVVFWEALTGKRLFAETTPEGVVGRILRHDIEPPSRSVDDASRELERLDAIVLRALAHEPDGRFSTAREMALAIENVGLMASASEIAQWVELVASDALHERARYVAEIEKTSTSVRAMPGEPVPAGASQEPRPHGDRRLSPNRRDVAIAATVAAIVAAVFTIAALKWANRNTTSQADPRPGVVAVVPAEPWAAPAAPASAGTSPAAPANEAIAQRPSDLVARPAYEAKVKRVSHPTPGNRTKNCAQASTLDSSGRRHFKVECLN